MSQIFNCPIFSNVPYSQMSQILISSRSSNVPNLQQSQILKRSQILNCLVSSDLRKSGTFKVKDFPIIPCYRTTSVLDSKVMSQNVPELQISTILLAFQLSQSQIVPNHQIL